METTWNDEARDIAHWASREPDPIVQLARTFAKEAVTRSASMTADFDHLLGLLQQLHGLHVDFTLVGQIEAWAHCLMYDGAELGAVVGVAAARHADLEPLYRNVALSSEESDDINRPYRRRVPVAGTPAVQEHAHAE